MGKKSKRVCYLIQAENGGPIKIGASSAGGLAARIATLQIGHPVELCFVRAFAGPRDLERRLHQEFRAYRIRGEWFSRQLLTRIDEDAASLGAHHLCTSEITDRVGVVRCFHCHTQARARVPLAQLLGDIYADSAGLIHAPLEAGVL